MVDLRLGEQDRTPRATMAYVSELIEASSQDASAAAATSADRIMRAVEWQRYGLPGLADENTSSARPRAGALTEDLRCVQKVLAHRAGPVRRMVATLAPRSLLAFRVDAVTGEAPSRDAVTSRL